MNDFFHSLFSNSVFSGGFLLLVSGAVMALCRKLPSEIYRLIKRQLVVEADILSDDQAYQWLKLWLHAHPYSKRARVLSASTIGGGRDDESTTRNDRPRVIFTPAPGSHFFFYKRRLIWLSRERKEANAANGVFAFWRETMTITVLGRNQNIIRDLINDAMLLALPADDTRISITVSVWGSWRQIALKQPREVASVILKEGVFESLLSSLKTFLNSKEYYASMGIPWRFGVLLEGIAGSGKTSTVEAVAGALRMNLYILNLAGMGMNDERLNNLLVDVPEKSIVLLEDMDAIFEGRQHTDEESHVSFSGLLNALCGAASKEGRVLFITTNHVEKLDSALIRPGRVDLPLHFGYATSYQIAQFFSRFFPNANDFQVESFTSLVSTSGRDVSMADIQQHLLAHRSSVEEAIATWPAGESFKGVPEIKVDWHIERADGAAIGD